MDEENIYLDYAANTPVDPEVLKVFNETTLKYFANPNSTHKLGLEVNEKIKETTKNIMEMFQKETNLENDREIIYTSGSSESNNLAIKGIAQSYKENGKHIITTFLEHSSVSSPLTYLKEQGYEIDVLNITNDGKVDIEQLKSLIRQDTILVSICYVDSEVGIVQPIKEIANILKDYPNCFLHVDCTQAIGKIKMNLENVDLISFAPHKFYGLNGFGGLIKRKAIEFKQKLEEYGICISIKSACTVTITPSRIVMAMTHDRKRAFASWRISLSHLVKEEKIEKFLKIFDECYKSFSLDN